MTNTELLAKIKAETESRIELHDSLASNAESEMIANLEIGAAQALDELLSFLSTLESEKPMNPSGSSEIPKELKEAGEKEYPFDKSWMTDSMLDMNAHCQVAFWKGAKWQREQDRLEIANIKAKLWQDGFDDCKEQMMKDAVEGRVSYFESREVAVIYYDDPKGNTMCLFAPSSSLETGDKVRIIIVKEDEK